MTIKTANAQRVLQLMDSCEDGQDRYREFVIQVSTNAKMSYAQLEKELDPFI